MMSDEAFEDHKGFTAYLRSMWACRFFWLSLVRNDLRAKYRRSMLGLGWSLLQPLATALVLGTVFAGIFDLDPTTYGMYLIIGLCFWNYLSGVANLGCTSMLAGESYIRQYPAPMAIYPLRTVLGAAIHFSVALGFLIVVSWCMYGFGNLLALTSLIPTMLLLLVFGWSLAALMGLANVYFHDTQHLVEVALQILFYATPIIYLPSMLEEKASAVGNAAVWMINANPLGAFVMLLRQPLQEATFPSPQTFLVAAILTMLTAGGAALALSPLTSKAFPAKRLGEFFITGQRHMARLQLDNVGLTFRVRYGGRVPLKEYVLNLFHRRQTSPVIEVNALSDISMNLTDGDRIGIIGHNGAGKSTLLKVLAGIYEPTAGKRRVSGRISSLFDISLGFEMEATGWQNIAYRSFLQGETPKSIRPKMKAIAEFSELGDFLNMPVRYYSSGMFVRLAFSIATAIEPEILLVDEALGAGDLAFQQKVRERIREIVSKARVLVVVSHDMDAVKSMCDKIVWLDHGRVRQVGPSEEVADAYTEFMKQHQAPPAEALPNLTAA
ncbi:Teichoic acids export ATP-binding protein TagH [Durusdinium trenchii]|uniref:Teichoic acids export ATP-binding protein TagH n=1 Tax=Durusdinium trenchii TaxID=1381693 RepID=A0ABP0QDQ0_9DINO